MGEMGGYFEVTGSQKENHVLKIAYVIVFIDF